MTLSDDVLAAALRDAGYEIVTMRMVALAKVGAVAGVRAGMARAEAICRDMAEAHGPDKAVVCDQCADAIAEAMEKL